MKHLHLIGLPCQQAVDLDAFCLADPMTPRLSLKVVLGRGRERERTMNIDDGFEHGSVEVIKKLDLTTT